MSQLQKKFIAANAVDGTKIRLSNAEVLRARNAANSADVSILQVNASDRIVFSSVPQVAADPSVANDLVRKSYVDAVLQGLKPKASVRAASTANIALTGGASLTVDTVVLVNGDRLLLKDQTAPAENGIYDVSGIGTAYTLTRSSDFDSLTPINEIRGAYTFVIEGTQSAKSFVETANPTVLNTDPIVFVHFNDASGVTAAQISYNNATSGLTATNVQDAIDEVDGNLDDVVTLTGVALGSTNLATFTGTTIPDSSTIKSALQALETAHESTDAKVDDLITLSGVAANSTNLGTFTGTTIPDSSTVKSALQSLETAVEAVQTVIPRQQIITLSGGDITNQYVDLAVEAYSAASISLTVVGGPLQLQAVDYTVSLTGGVAGVTRLTFAGDLATGGAAELVAADILIVVYSSL